MEAKANIEKRGRKGGKREFALRSLRTTSSASLAEQICNCFALV